MNILDFIDALIDYLLATFGRVRWSTLHQDFRCGMPFQRHPNRPPNSIAHLRIAKIFSDVVSGPTFDDDRGALIESHRSVIFALARSLLLEEAAKLHTLAAHHPDTFVDPKVVRRFMTAFDEEGQWPSILGHEIFLGFVERIRNAIDLVEVRLDAGVPIPTTPEMLLEQATTWAAGVRFDANTIAHPLHRFSDGWRAIVLGDDETMRLQAIAVGQPIAIHRDGTFASHPHMRPITISLIDDTTRPVATLYVDRKVFVAWNTAPFLSRNCPIETYAGHVFNVLQNLS